MSEPVSKTKKIVEAGETKFELATNIKGSPLLAHDVRITDPQGNAIDVPARDLFQFVAQAFVAPYRQEAIEAAIDEGDFASVLLGRI